MADLEQSSQVKQSAGAADLQSTGNQYAGDYGDMLTAMGVDVWIPTSQLQQASPSAVAVDAVAERSSQQLMSAQHPPGAAFTWEQLYYRHPQQAGLQVLASFSAQSASAKAERHLLTRMLAAIDYQSQYQLLPSQVTKPLSQSNVATLQFGELPQPIHNAMDTCSEGATPTAVHGQLFTTYALAEIQQDPSLKPEVWRLLKTLRQFVQQ